MHVIRQTLNGTAHYSREGSAPMPSARTSFVAHCTRFLRHGTFKPLCQPVGTAPTLFSAIATLLGRHTIKLSPFPSSNLRPSIEKIRSHSRDYIHHAGHGATIFLLNTERHGARLGSAASRHATRGEDRCGDEDHAAGAYLL